MEAEPDNFLKVLQKRQRNLAKKLDRIRKKQAEVKSSNKEMKEEERKMIESAPQIEELISENEKLLQQYSKHLESSQKEVKKPQAKPEDDKTKEIVSLWVLGEFLSNPQIKEKYLKDNSTEQDLDAFLLLHSQVKGESGDSLAEIKSKLEKSIDLYLAKSDKIAPGTLRSYRKLSEFASRGISWAFNQVLPQTPVKKELSVQSGSVYSTQVPAPEVKVEEVKVEEKFEPKVEKKSEPAVLKWADHEDDLSDDKEEVKAKPESGSNDDGFIEVKKRAKGGQGGQRNEEFERRGRGRGDRRGRGRGERRGGRRGGNDS